MLRNSIETFGIKNHVKKGARNSRSCSASGFCSKVHQTSKERSVAILSIPLRDCLKCSTWGTVFFSPMLVLGSGKDLVGIALRVGSKSDQCRVGKKIFWSEPTCENASLSGNFQFATNKLNVAVTKQQRVVLHSSSHRPGVVDWVENAYDACVRHETLCTTAAKQQQTKSKTSYSCVGHCLLFPPS